MKFAVDRIVEQIVVLENIDTEDIIEVEKDKLPVGVHEGSILIFDGNDYKLDLKTEKNRRESFRERLNRLKKHN